MSGMERRQGLTQFFGMEEFLDVILEVETSGQGSFRFGCHKIELAKASRRFKEILRNKSLPADDDDVTCIYVTDLDAETLLKILCHIYNEEITETQMDGKLLEAARRYQLDNLVRMCLLAAIPKQLNVKNVSKAVETAFELDLSDIKKEALQFIWTNVEEVSRDESFTKLLKEKPNLMTNILCELKTTVSATIRNESSDEKIQLYTKSGRSLDGKPVFLGNFSDDIQELSLPSTLPVTAKAVRILYNIRSTGVLVSMWSNTGGVKYDHFFYAVDQDEKFQSCQLFFPIDKDNQKIYARMPKGCVKTFNVYLIDYLE